MPDLILHRAQGHRPGSWNPEDYDVLADGRDIGRIFRKVGAGWWWGLGFQFIGRKSYGTAESLDEAKAAFRAEYERWKESGLTISDTESMNDRDPNGSAKFSFPPAPMPERILHKLGDLFWLIVIPLAAAVAGYVFLNMTIGMSLGTWLIALFVMYLWYRICVRLDLLNADCLPPRPTDDAGQHAPAIIKNEATAWAAKEEIVHEAQRTEPTQRHDCRSHQGGDHIPCSD